MMKIKRNKEHIFNIGLQQLGFMEQLDWSVVVVSGGQNIVIDHAPL